MSLEHYIAELLYRYNCIVVPNFGAFLTQQKSAVISEDTHAFYPPSKEISFNRQLVSNDGLLVSYMAEAQKSSYETVLAQLSEEIQKWENVLKKGGRLSLDNIGDLWQNTEGKILFEPQQQVNYLTTSYGLSSFVSTPITREVLKEEVTALEEQIPFIITPEQRQKGNFRPLLKYAAVALLALSLGFTGYSLYNTNKNNQLLAQEEAQELVSKNIQEATFFDTEPLELPAVFIEINKKPTKRLHHVIAGAFREHRNAERKVKQLRRKGYDASIIGVNKFGLYQVAYDSFFYSKEALKAYNTIRRTESKDAWILSSK